jgi:DNA-binding NarL/FixJ family response regulator
VAVHAADPVTRAGIAALLAGKSRLEPAELPQPGDDREVDVVVVVDDPLDDLPQSLQHVHQVCPRAHIVLITGAPRPIDLFNAVGSGLAAIIPRSEATADRLTRAVHLAGHSQGDLPAAAQGRLLELIRHLQRAVLRPRGLTAHGLEQREVDVLRLVARGLSTREIGLELSYSERTVKSVLHTVMTRLDLRSRAHAVAYAIRAGLI